MYSGTFTQTFIALNAFLENMSKCKTEHKLYGLDHWISHLTNVHTRTHTHCKGLVWAETLACRVTNTAADGHGVWSVSVCMCSRAFENEPRAKQLREELTLT